MCALQESLGDVGRIEMYALLFIIIIYDSSIIIAIINIYYYLEFYIVPH